MKILLFILLTITHITFVPDTAIHEYRLPGITISYDTGIVDDEAGNGHTTTPGTNPEYNYIKYSPEETHTGDNVTSIYIYNPFTLYGDDIAARFDF